MSCWRRTRFASILPMPVASAAPRGGAGGGGVRAGRDPEGHLAVGRRLGQRGQAVVAAGKQRVPGRQRDAVLQAGALSDGVDEAVHPGHAVGVGALQPGQPQHGALDRDRGVRPGHLDDRLAGLGRQRARLADDRGVEVEVGSALFYSP